MLPQRLLKRRLLPVYSVLLLVCGLMVWLLHDLPAPETVAQHLQRPSNLILDRQGRLLYEVTDPQTGKHGPLALNDIPLACRQATIATEDKNFYSNLGVDPLAIVRAVWQNWRAGSTVSGASSLSQQLARNLLLQPQERSDHSLWRKLREAVLAVRLNQVYPKDALLALYLNQTYYGHYAYGIGAAADAYFGKRAEELDLAECALLAGLPQSPVAYSPLEDPSAAHGRQATVLSLMVNQGYISQAQADLAVQEPLHLTATPFPIHAPHFVMAVQGWLEQNIDPALLQAGGLRIYTTLDLDWQQITENNVRYRLAQIAQDPKAPADRRVENAAVFAVEPDSGAVRVMVGSPDYFNSKISGAVNAVYALRQPGSAIKPVTYAAAFGAEGADPWTPATMVLDEHTAFPTREGLSYVPMNYDLRWHGWVSLRQALAASYNLPAVKVLDHIGFQAFGNQATRLGLTTLSDPTKTGLSITLGGGEVRLAELTAAYAAFANGGRSVTPYVVERIERIDGKTVWAHTPAPDHEAVSPQVAFLITDILSDNNARVPTFGEGSVLEIDRPAAVKTGTTTDWRDNWTVGYTPDIAVGVWVGNADGTPMLDISGVTGAGPIWHDTMLTILNGRPLRDFAQPQGVTQTVICTDSGLRPADTNSCPLQRMEWFVDGKLPAVSNRQSVVSGQQLLGNDTHFSMAGLGDNAYSRQLPTSHCPLPTVNCQLSTAFSFSSPDPQSVFRLTPGVPLSDQQVEVAVRGVNQADAVALYVDGTLLTQLDHAPWQTWWTLKPGEHRFYAVASSANQPLLQAEPVVVTVMP